MQVFASKITRFIKCKGCGGQITVNDTTTDLCTACQESSEKSTTPRKKKG